MIHHNTVRMDRERGREREKREGGDRERERGREEREKRREMNYIHLTWYTYLLIKPLEPVGFLLTTYKKIN